MTPAAFAVAAISLGYSSLWARREEFRYTFPIGAARR